MPDGGFPTRFPIFPLPNVVLFPDAQLPLHIFEPRYRAMTERALGGDAVLGMVLLRPDARPEDTRAPVYPVGCAGRIARSQRLPDGRFHILLQGERRFRIQREEATDEAYRTVCVELLPDLGFSELEAADRAEIQELRPQLERMVLELAAGARVQHIERLSAQMNALDPIALMHALALGLECGVVEKQGLLEAPDPLERCRLLLRLLEFREAERRLTSPPKMIN